MNFINWIEIKKNIEEIVLVFVSFVKSFYNLPDEALIDVLIETLDVYKTTS